MPGKIILTTIPRGIGKQTEAGKKGPEGTESGLKFGEIYFQDGVKLLLNWKYGIRVC